ncbi:MAG: type II and III secretion system protein family protein [Paracoccaceae bacterium]|nr:type II and III secretion system protein family protein [Paracoccaceae bacterium]MDG1372328.1 type II and III secretion system protein family protein [Paracoccaceae bacterium]
MRMRLLLVAALAATGLSLATPVVVEAQATDNVLRVARGATSRDISVFINRAIVLESAQRFAEVSVANPGIADVAALSDQTIYILGKANGVTTLTLLGEGGKLITNVEVRVTPDLSEFKQRLREVLPTEQIEVREANGGVILSGVVSGARKIDTAMNLASRYAGENVTNLMSVGGTQQVMLKIRFAEMSRSASKSLGLNFGALFNNSRTAVSGQTNQFGQAGNTPGGAGFVDASGGFGIARVITSVGGVLFDVVLNALEQKGVARTLAEPNLVALSGDTAEFLAGGEVPIPVAGEDGAITVSFKPFGIGMSFTPTVIDGDLINLVLETEVSAIDTSVQVTAAGITLSGFTTRRARTTVELRDGQSLSIAGLLQEDFADGKTQIPWLGDLPILGTLFRSSDFSRSQSELVIIVTPHLVTPVDSDQLSLPTDRIRIPNEKELFLYGMLEGDSPAAEVASQGLDGNYGYVLE